MKPSRRCSVCSASHLILHDELIEGQVCYLPSLSRFPHLGKKLFPHGDRAESKKNSERHGVRSGVSYSAVGAPWHRHWTSWGRLGLHATVCTLNMLNVCAVARRCEMRAVGTPAAAAAVRSPTVPQERRRRAPWTPRERRCWRRRLHGDLTKSMEVPPRLYHFVAACLRRLHCVCIECYRFHCILTETVRSCYGDHCAPAALLLRPSDHCRVTILVSLVFASNYHPVAISLLIVRWMA